MKTVIFTEERYQDHYEALFSSAIHYALLAASSPTIAFTGTRCARLLRALGDVNPQCALHTLNEVDKIILHPSNSNSETNRLNKELPKILSEWREKPDFATAESFARLQDCLASNHRGNKATYETPR